MISDQNARLSAARKLTDVKARRQSGRFLAEGAPAVREALARPNTVVELFVVPGAGDFDEFVRAATRERVPVSEISPVAARSLSETVSPQGLVAVCRRVDRPLAEALATAPLLVAALVGVNDPGNAGTILRAADAAGADAVILTSGSVDIYNGKAVRASAGSLFHLDVVIDADPLELITAATRAGLRALATSGRGDADLDSLAVAGALAGATLWLFGNEARGLPASVLSAADDRVRVPIYGRAESLNLATAAAICLYQSARAQRHS